MILAVSTWWGVPWADALTSFAAVGATVAAVIGGIFALQQLSALRSQVQHAQESSAAALEQSERARKTSIKPVVVFRGPSLILRDWPLPAGHLRVRSIGQVRVRNVGLGTALDVRVKAWIVPCTPQPRERDWEAISAAVLGAPHATGDVTAIASGNEEAVYLGAQGGTPAPWGNQIAALVVLTVTYEDLDGVRHETPSSMASLVFVERACAELP